MKLNAIFGSHMVFAAGLPIRVYGNGKGDEPVAEPAKFLGILIRTDSTVENRLSFGGT